MDRSKPASRLNIQVYEDACTWLIAFRKGRIGANAKAQFDAWLQASPEHTRAYHEVSAIWEEDARRHARCAAAVEGIVARARAEGDGVAFEATGLVTRGWLIRGSYSTDIGEQRSMTLADGSGIDLNTRSHIKVCYTAKERHIDLLGGQALFHVARDRVRPFIVRSARTSMRAVDAQFEVYRKRSNTFITVIEGSVAVSTYLQGAAASRGQEGARLPRSAAAVSEDSGMAPGDTDWVVNQPETGRSPALAAAQTGEANRRMSSDPRAEQEGESAGPQPSRILLTAGKQLRITASTAKLVNLADLGAAAAWTQRRLVFDSAPLSEVVEEFNRYNTRALVVDAPELESFRVTAVFSSTGVSALVRFLRAQAGILVEEGERQVRIAHERE